jgi:hypothetical protein
MATLAQSKDAKGHDKTWSDYNDTVNNGVLYKHTRDRVRSYYKLSYNGATYQKKYKILNCMSFPIFEMFEFTWK